jgi:hypothetical protein
MAPYWWIELSKVWYFATVWGLTEGQWIFREEETIFEIPGHKRNALEDRPKNTNHDKKQSNSVDAIQYRDLKWVNAVHLVPCSHSDKVRLVVDMRKIN